MSTDLGEKDGLLFTNFYGGVNRGKCLQIERDKPEDDYSAGTLGIQLTLTQCESLHEFLGEYLEKQMIVGQKRIPIKEFQRTPSSVLRELKKRLADAKSKTYEHRIYCICDAILLYRAGVTSTDRSFRYEWC